MLTDDEIAKAAGVIVACDTNVPTDRFDGKKVIECQVSDGINKAEELIKRIAAGDAPVFKASGKKRLHIHQLVEKRALDIRFISI